MLMIVVIALQKYCCMSKSYMLLPVHQTSEFLKMRCLSLGFEHLLALHSSFRQLNHATVAHFLGTISRFRSCTRLAGMSCSLSLY